MVNGNTQQQQPTTPTTPPSSGTSLANRIYLDVLKREFNITKGVEQFTTQQLNEFIRVLRLNASTFNLNGGMTTTNNNFGMNPPMSQSSPSKPVHQPHFYQPPSPSQQPSYQAHGNQNNTTVTPQKVHQVKRPHSSIEVISLDNSPVTSSGVTDDVIFVKAEVKTETTPTKRRNGRQTATTPGSSPMSSSSGMASPHFNSPMSTASSQGFTTPPKTDRKNILGPYLDGSFKPEQQQIHTPLNNGGSISFSQNAPSHVPTPTVNDLANLHLDQYSQLLFSPSTSIPLSQLNINSPKSSTTATPSSSQIKSSPQTSSQLITNPSSPPELKITNAATPKAHSEKKKSSRKKKDTNPTPPPATTIPADSPLAIMSSPPASSTEKRKKKFVSSCSEKLLDRIQRALTQRLFLIGRKDKKEYEETFAVFGTTGNVYDVHVCEVPTCSCPDFKRGNFCKHILFVYLRVLRIPATHYVVYQKALMKSELEAIFSHAPQVLASSLKASDDVIQNYNNLMSQDTSQLIIGQQRKSLTGSHCPICYEDFIIGKEKTDHCLVCGTNVHEECLKAWKSYDKNFPCPHCKTPQFGKGQSSVLATSEGYCNLSQYQPNTPKCR